MTIAGIDGCKGGWLCIEELKDGLRVFIARNIRDAVDLLPLASHLQVLLKSLCYDNGHSIALKA